MAIYAAYAHLWLPPINANRPPRILKPSVDDVRPTEGGNGGVSAVAVTTDEDDYDRATPLLSNVNNITI